MQIGERAYQSFSPEVRQSSDGKKTVFKISTGDKDRHGSIIDIAGIDLEAFKRNPVVLFNHDYDKVIARASNIQVRGGFLVAEVEFDEEDDYAANIARKVRSGFVNAASIGFMVKEWTVDETDDTFRVTSSELVEFSIVAVPSNREALVISRDLRQQVQDLTEQVRRLTEPQKLEVAGNGMVINPGDLLSAVKRAHPAAKQAPESPADEASVDTPAEDAADPVPDAEAARQEPEQVAPVAPQPAREATEADYRAIAQAMAPVIRQQVLRALGKA